MRPVLNTLSRLQNTAHLGRRLLRRKRDGGKAIISARRVELLSFSPSRLQCELSTNSCGLLSMWAFVLWAFVRIPFLLTANWLVLSTVRWLWQQCFYALLYFIKFCWFYTLLLSEFCSLLLRRNSLPDDIDTGLRCGRVMRICGRF